MTKYFSDFRSNPAEVSSSGSKPAKDGCSYLKGISSADSKPAVGVDPNSPSITLIGTAEASRITGLSQQTLNQGRSSGLIPLNYVKLGRRVFYRLEDVERYINDHVVVCGGAE